MSAQPQIDFRYAPRVSQATMCFPNDPKKTWSGRPAIFGVVSRMGSRWAWRILLPYVLFPSWDCKMTVPYASGSARQFKLHSQRFLLRRQGAH